MCALPPVRGAAFAASAPASSRSARNAVPAVSAAARKVGREPPGNGLGGQYSRNFFWPGMGTG